MEKIGIGRRGGEGGTEGVCNGIGGEERVGMTGWKNWAGIWRPGQRYFIDPVDHGMSDGEEGARA